MRTLQEFCSLVVTHTATKLRCSGANQSHFGHRLAHQLAEVCKQVVEEHVDVFKLALSKDSAMGLAAIALIPGIVEQLP